MGLLDKVKAQATAATEMAKDAAAKGQAKMNEAQAKRAADGMLRDLGAAFYATMSGHHDRVENSEVGLAGIEQGPNAEVLEVGEAERDAFDPFQQVVHALRRTVGHLGLVPGDDGIEPVGQGPGQGSHFGRSRTPRSVIDDVAQQ